MPQPIARHRVLLAIAGGALAVAAIGVPALGQVSPPRDDGAATLGAPPSEKPGKGPKASHVPDEPITLTGRVGTRTEADGGTVYTITAGGTVHDLDAGPAWFWGDSHPLAGLVGRTVTVEGDRAPGSTSVDVRVADGTAIREAGKPPWAGGWKVVGRKHPGWTEWKAEKAAAKDAAGHGRPSWAGPKPKGSAAPDQQP